MTSNITDLSYKSIIKLAWPASIAASITPLLGAIDVWALGRSPNPLDIAAVGLAALIFSLIYWTFGFIRMSVAGLTSQAAGAGDVIEMRLTFLRALFLAMAIGILMVILQWPIGKTAFHLLSIGSKASAGTVHGAQDYFAGRIWGAPFALGTYACLGWLTARGRTDYLMVTAIIMTGLNIILDIVFVIILFWGPLGIAIGTMIAEITGFILSCYFVIYLLNKDGTLNFNFTVGQILNPEKVKHTLSINSDIFIRTLLLAFSFSWFVQHSSAFGDTILAANQVLLQLFLFTGMALDGTAIAAEILVGQVIGEKSKDKKLPNTIKIQQNESTQHEKELPRIALNRYDLIIRRTFIIATIGALSFTFVYLVFGQFALGLLVPEGVLFDTAWQFWGWVTISPLIVMVCFQLDGIFVGATQSREMRNSMIISTFSFIILSLWLASQWSNHGLWLAFSLYFILRAVTLTYYLPRVRALCR